MREPVRAVPFDLLTALLDSWTVWNAAAGSEAAGRAWRAEYLRLTCWHNRAGLVRPAGAPAPELESPTLDALCDWIDGPALPPAPRSARP